MIESRSERQVMNGVVLRCTAIDAHRVASNSVDLALDQQFDGLRRKPREMHVARFILIAVALNIRPSRRPTRPKQGDRPGRNLPVALFPLAHPRGWELVVRVSRGFR